MRRLAGSDLAASLIVFLVALPLCLGIALASGATPAQGIITGIVGGLIAGVLSGAPLQVSGPAAGLTVTVFGVIHDFGMASLGPAVLAAGALQVIGGVLRGGGLARKIPHCVVEAMLAAIGVTIAASQIYVLGDLAPAGSVFANIAGLPRLFAGNGAAFFAGGITIAALHFWERAAPMTLRLLPAPLVALLIGTGLASLLHLNLHHVTLPASLLHAVRLPDWAGVRALMTPGGAFAVISLAVIASLESLLSAAAIQRMAGKRGRANFNRELWAQGVGNMVCGGLGCLPMTGVIVRSAANVAAGARSRASAILHGAWLLLVVELFPGVLRLVPTSALAALLFVVGVRLVSPVHIRAARADKALLAYVATIGVSLGFTLLPGVAAGWGVYRLSRMRRHN
jgi:MFS superfamily sulfate permease-like transporter